MLKLWFKDWVQQEAEIVHTIAKTQSRTCDYKHCPILNQITLVNQIT